MASLVGENHGERLCKNYSDHNISNNGQHVYSHSHRSSQHVQHDKLFIEPEVSSFSVHGNQIDQNELTTKNHNNNENEDSSSLDIKESAAIKKAEAEETRDMLIEFEDIDDIEIIIYVEKGHEVRVGIVSKTFIPTANQMILAASVKIPNDTRDENYSKRHDLEIKPACKEPDATDKKTENHKTPNKKEITREEKHVHFQERQTPKHVYLRSHKMVKDRENHVYHGVESVRNVGRDWRTDTNNMTDSKKANYEEPASKSVSQNTQRRSSHISSSESDLGKSFERKLSKTDRCPTQLTGEKKISILRRGCDIATVNEQSNITKDSDSKENKKGCYTNYSNLLKGNAEIRQKQGEKDTKMPRSTVHISASHVITTAPSADDSRVTRRSKSTIDADAKSIEEKREKERQRKKLSRRKQRKYKYKMPKTELEIFQNQIETGQLRSMFSRYKTEGLKCLTLLELLHKGTFSNKYKASFKNKQVVLTIYNAEIADLINALDMTHMGNSYFVLGFSDCMTGPHGRLWFMSLFHSIGDLQKLLSRDRNRHVIGELHAQFITAGVLIGVDFLHQHDIVHGNIKPSKVLINALGYPVLTGFVKMTDKSDREGNEAYTPAYVAPEHLRGNRGTAIDVFSVGCLAYEIITGWTPFDGDTREQTLQNIQRACRPIYDPELFSFAGEFFIDSCLRRNPKERFWIGVERNNLIFEEWFSTIDWRDFRRQILPSPVLDALQLLENRATLTLEEKAVQFKWGRVMDVMCPYTPSLEFEEDIH